MGIVGKGPPAASASPAGEPNHDRQHAIADDISQVTSSQFVRSQDGTFPAARTTLPVSMSISRIRSHPFVVPLDQSFEIVDVQSIDFLRRSEVPTQNTSLLFSCARAWASTEDERGGVLDVIYRGEVKGGIPAGSRAGSVYPSRLRVIAVRQSRPQEGLLTSSVFCPVGATDNSPALQCWERGNMTQRSGERPGGTPEGHRGICMRPSGTRPDIFIAPYPAMNRWATVGRPSGTKSRKRRLPAPAHNGRLEAYPAKDSQTLSTHYPILC